MIERWMISEDGRMYHVFKNGEARVNGFLEDYSNVGYAFIYLYLASGDEQWIGLATRLTNYTISHFFDESDNLFWFTSDLDDALSARTKEIYDNVIPSSNSVMAFTLYELSQITTNREFEKIAFSMLKSIGNNLTRHASSFAHWGALMLNHVNNFYTIVITGPDAGLWQHELYEKCKYPLKIILWGNDGATLPVFHGRLGKGQTTIYVCAGNVCKLPVHSVEEALRQIC